MPNDRCKQLFSNVNEGMICIDTDADTEAGENVGVCSGDSGGPLNLQEGPGQYMTVGNGIDDTSTLVLSRFLNTVYRA